MPRLVALVLIMMASLREGGAVRRTGREHHRDQQQLSLNDGGGGGARWTDNDGLAMAEMVVLTTSTQANLNGCFSSCQFGKLAAKTANVLVAAAVAQIPVIGPIASSILFGFLNSVINQAGAEEKPKPLTQKDLDTALEALTTKMKTWVDDRLHEEFVKQLLIEVKWWYATYKDFTALFLGKTESEYPACDDSSGINYTPYLTAIMLKTTDLMIFLDEDWNSTSNTIDLKTLMLGRASFALAGAATTFHWHRRFCKLSDDDRAVRDSGYLRKVAEWQQLVGAWYKNWVTEFYQDDTGITFQCEQASENLATFTITDHACKIGEGPKDACTLSYPIDLYGGQTCDTNTNGEDFETYKNRYHGSRGPFISAKMKAISTFAPLTAYLRNRANANMLATLSPVSVMATNAQGTPALLSEEMKRYSVGPISLGTIAQQLLAGNDGDTTPAWLKNKDKNIREESPRGDAEAAMKDRTIDTNNILALDPNLYSRSGGGCTSEPCDEPFSCRSGHGYCGTSPQHCNASATWSPACTAQQCPDDELWYNCEDKRCKGLRACASNTGLMSCACPDQAAVREADRAERLRTTATATTSYNVQLKQQQSKPRSYFESLNCQAPDGIDGVTIGFSQPAELASWISKPHLKTYGTHEIDHREWAKVPFICSVKYSGGNKCDATTHGMVDRQAADNSDDKGNWMNLPTPDCSDTVDFQVSSIDSGPGPSQYVLTNIQTNPSQYGTLWWAVDGENRYKGGFPRSEEMIKAGQYYAQTTPSPFGKDPSPFGGFEATESTSGSVSAWLPSFVTVEFALRRCSTAAVVDHDTYNGYGAQQCQDDKLWYNLNDKRCNTSRACASNKGLMSGACPALDAADACTVLPVPFLHSLPEFVTTKPLLPQENWIQKIIARGKKGF